MPTLNDLIDETLGMVRGYTRTTEQSTHLASSVTSSGTTMTVGDASRLTHGVCEVDSEMIFIDSVDTTTNIATIAPYGRGFNNTTAAAHTSNTRVIMNPIFPRKQVKDAINNTLLSLRGYLYGTATTNFSFNAAVEAYSLPSTTNTVARVEWKDVGPSKSYLRVRGWRFNPNADTDMFPTGKTIEIYDGVTPGQRVQVWCTTDIQTMANDSDDFVTVTSLPESCRDLVTIGAASRLMSTVDAYSLDTFNAEASVIAGKTPQGSAANISKYLYSLFVQRRTDEVGLQSTNTPISTHWSR